MLNFEKLSFSRALRSDAIALAGGSITGVIVFLAIWGVEPLRIFNFDWIVRPWGGDQSFVAISMLRFMKEPWTFPLGLITGLIYPLKTSVVYSDSIPLIAILAKCIAKLTGATFQYIGWWGLFCLMMQGGLSAVIMQTYRPNALVSTIASAFFVTSICILGRMFGHISMTGQWVILLGLLLVWRRNSPFVVKNEIWLWSLAVTLSVGFLLYLTPMVLATLGLLCLLVARDVGIRAAVSRLWPTISSAALASIVMLYFIGGFLTGFDNSINDYGIAPLNLNSFINPAWNSFLVQPLSTSPHDSGESNLWLGLGLLLGAIIVLTITFLDPREPARKLLQLWPYWIFSVVLMAYATTNNIWFGNHQLLSFDLPKLVSQAASVFRTSARFAWPVWYIITIAIIGRLILLSASAWRASALLLTLLLIQLADGQRLLSFITRESRLRGTTELPLSSPFWTNMSSVADKLFYLPFTGRIMADHEKWGYIAYQAARQNIATNSFWMGRYPMKSLQEAVAGKIADVKNGKIDDGDLIVVQDVPTLTAFDLPASVRSYLVDSQVVLSKKNMTGMRGVCPIEIHRATVAEFLRGIESLKGRYALVVTARDTARAALDRPTVQALSALNLGRELESAPANYNYAAVSIAGRGVVFERMSVGEAISFRQVDPDLQIQIDAKHGLYPTILLDGFDASITWSGANIAAYDLDEKKISRVGSFNLNASGVGVYYQITHSNAGGCDLGVVPH